VEGVGWFASQEATMHAKQGDWLVTEARDLNHHARRGVILSVESTDGSPPYRVRWEDDGHEALCIPGPDTRVVAAGDEAATRP
jgi:hypothetical protein